MHNNSNNNNNLRVTIPKRENPLSMNPLINWNEFTPTYDETTPPINTPNTSTYYSSSSSSDDELSSPKRKKRYTSDYYSNYFKPYSNLDEFLKFYCYRDE